MLLQVFIPQSNYVQIRDRLVQISLPTCLPFTHPLRGVRAFLSPACYVGG